MGWESLSSWKKKANFKIKNLHGRVPETKQAIHIKFCHTHARRILGSIHNLHYFTSQVQRARAVWHSGSCPINCFILSCAPSHKLSPFNSIFCYFPCFLHLHAFSPIHSSYHTIFLICHAFFYHQIHYNLAFSILSKCPYHLSTLSSTL